MGRGEGLDEGELGRREDDDGGGWGGEECGDGLRGEEGGAD